MRSATPHLVAYTWREENNELTSVLLLFHVGYVGRFK